MRRYCLLMALALAVGVAPQSVWADDNAIAQFIVQKLKVEQDRGALKGFHVDMRVDRGTVWFEGYVSNAQQESLILRTAQQAGSLGVMQIVDDIDVRSVRPAPQVGSADQLIPARESYGRQPALPVAYRGDMQPTMQEPMYAPVSADTTRRFMPTAVSQAPVNIDNGAPLPAGYTNNMGVVSENPQLPAYAWPGYAAHPNYAAVSYPRQYSASAWPYIGPFYPYPQVPLGWRRVTLEWDDGWWYLDFDDHPHH